MNKDDEKLSELIPLLKALKIAIEENGNNQDIEQFKNNVFRNFIKDGTQSAKALQSNAQSIFSILESTYLPYEVFIKRCKLTERQLQLLVKLRVLILRNECVYLGEVKPIPPAIAKTLISFFALIAIGIAATIVINPFPGIWLWPLAYGLGGFIGSGIGMTLDRSFKLYKIIEQLKDFIDWLPKDSKNRHSIV